MIHQTLNRWRYLLENIPQLLSSIKEEEFSMKINATKWSKREILGHLIDSASNNHQRFIRVQYEHIPTITYDQNKWNELSYYQDLSKGHLISLWAIYNRHLYEIVNRIPEEHLLKESNVGKDKNVTLQYIIDDYVVHLEHHLKQIVSY